MTLRQEIHAFIGDIPESKLIALKPLLFALADDSVVIEHYLTDEERGIIADTMAEYNARPTRFVPLDEIQ